MPAAVARTAAFDILLRVECEGSYASELLHSAAYQRLSRADHGLATELVMGVLRWRSLLDHEIAAASSQSLSKLDLEVLIALRLAVYQFRQLDRIPHRAALHDSVELVKHARKRSAAAFVNAVLRKLSTISPGLWLADVASPETLARTLAHPLWMVQRWAQEYGLPAAAAICNYDQSVPATAIRPRAAMDGSQLMEDGIRLSSGNLLNSARRVDAGDVTRTAAFRSGQIVVQDEASQLVAALISADTLPLGSCVLDCCAAPGGKTLAIADRNPGASVSAVDIHPHRVRLLRKLLHAAGAAERIAVIAADAVHLPLSSAFDRVLADVPCSGTGTLARNPEIKWRLTAADIADLRGRQSAILRSAMAHVAPGGRLIYSTCSLEREENETVVEQALAEERSFRVLDCRAELDRLKSSGELAWNNTASLTRGPYLRTIPGLHPCDGFFAATLEKKGNR